MYFFEILFTTLDTHRGGVEMYEITFGSAMSTAAVISNCS